MPLSLSANKQYSSKSCRFYLPNIFKVQPLLTATTFSTVAQAPSSPSWIITIALLTGLPCTPAPLASALYIAATEILLKQKSEHVRYPSTNTFQEFPAPLMFKAQGFIVTSKAPHFSCHLFPFLYLLPLISVL